MHQLYIWNEKIHWTHKLWVFVTVDYSPINCTFKFLWTDFWKEYHLNLSETNKLNFCYKGWRERDGKKKERERDKSISYSHYWCQYKRKRGKGKKKVNNMFCVLSFKFSVLYWWYSRLSTFFSLDWTICRLIWQANTCQWELKLFGFP